MPEGPAKLDETLDAKPYEAPRQRRLPAALCLGLGLIVVLAGWGAWWKWSHRVYAGKYFIGMTLADAQDKWDASECAVTTWSPYACPTEKEEDTVPVYWVYVKDDGLALGFCHNKRLVRVKPFDDGDYPESFREAGKDAPLPSPPEPKP